MNKKNVFVHLICYGQSYEKKAPVFLLKENKILLKPLASDKSPAEIISEILQEELDITYNPSFTSRNWVSPTLEDTINDNDNLYLIYSCIIPCDETVPNDKLGWKTIPEIMGDIKNIDDYTRKILYNYSTGNRSV